jgi:hypothetical protein
VSSAASRESLATAGGDSIRAASNRPPRSPCTSSPSSHNCAASIIGDGLVGPTLPSAATGTGERGRAPTRARCACPRRRRGALIAVDSSARRSSSSAASVSPHQQGRERPTSRSHGRCSKEERGAAGQHEEEGGRCQRTYTSRPERAAPAMEKKQPAVEWWGSREDGVGGGGRRWWVGVGGGEMDVGPTVGVGMEKRL